jgi:hypothetical protein
MAQAQGIPMIDASFGKPVSICGLQGTLYVVTDHGHILAFAPNLEILTATGGQMTLLVDAVPPMPNY